MSSLVLHGRRFLELQKWRFAVSIVQNSSAFSSASAATLQDGRKGHNFTVSSYLVESLGFTTKLAESISRKVSFKDKGNPDAVLNLLRSHGFTNSQISTIITDYPIVLIADTEKSLAPKLKFLQSRGASRSELTKILSKVPKILRMKEEKTMSRYYDFVKEVIKADKDSKFKELGQSSLPEGSRQENKLRNILALRELGVPQKFLFSLLISKFQTVSPVWGKEKFEESLKKVVEMGFDPTTSKFVHALQMLYQMSDKTIEEKVEVYKSIGFSMDEIWASFRRTPLFLNVSEKKILNSIETFLGLGFSRDEFVIMLKRFPQFIRFSAETIKKKNEFLVKQMNWPLKVLVSNPVVFGLSMEKRIVPRYNVMKALISKGFLGSELPPMPSILVITDQDFLDKYVRNHDDKELVDELLAIFIQRSCFIEQ